MPGQVAESLITLTFTPACFARIIQSIPVIKSLVAPCTPFESIHFTAMMLVVQLTPETPATLLVTAPNIPPTCEPCPL